MKTNTAFLALLIITLTSCGRKPPPIQEHKQPINDRKGPSASGTIYLGDNIDDAVKLLIDKGANQYKINMNPRPPGADPNEDPDYKLFYIPKRGTLRLAYIDGIIRKISFTEEGKREIMKTLEEFKP